MPDFYPEEIEELRAAYSRFCEIKSESNGSAYGEHYNLVALLKKMGVTDSFESSSQVENYIEQVLINGQKPTLY